jgi:hypothetical protein
MILRILRTLLKRVHEDPLKVAEEGEDPLNVGENIPEDPVKVGEKGS